MDEALLITGVFAVGAGAGALISYAHDRTLLALYGHLIQDLSRMVPRQRAGAPDPPATAMRVAEMPPLVEAQRKAAS